MPLLLRHPALRRLKRGRVRSTQVSNTYFDSSDFRLQKDGVALRVRRIGRRFVQTLKGPPRSGAGLHTRAEHEWPLKSEAPDLSHVAATPWKKLLAKAEQDGGLVPICSTEYERRSVELTFPDGTRAQLCADRGEIRAQDGGRVRRAAIAEVEIELQSGNAANLFRLALALAKDLPVGVMTQSKEARGYALRRGVSRADPVPVRATEILLDADATTTEALSAIARECLRQVAANAQGLLTDEDPEWVHQMRVGTRRLRSCLSLMKPFCPKAELEPLTAEVKWLATLLGEARDWDVFVTETLPPLAAWFARDASAAPGIKRLRDRAVKRRRDARKRTREGVASPRFQRLLLAGGLVSATQRLESAANASAADNAGTVASDSDSGRATVFAAKLIARRHRKFAELATALEHAGNDERHAARIAAKRLRYVAEFFSPLYPGKRTRTYLETLAATQDALGQFNDAVTAGTLAGELSGSADAAATGAVRGWVAAQAAAIEPRLAKALRRFHAAKPFWLAK
jgi:inorganic triphosphatase YgiF